MKWRVITVNPVHGVEPPRVRQKEMDFLTHEEAVRLVDALSGHEYELPILVGLYCGLRPTEYLALRWRDLDFDRAELRVMQNVHKVRDDRITEYVGQMVQGFRFGPTKTHRSKRAVSMPREMAALLQAWRLVQAVQRDAVGEAWVDLDLVFTDTVGRPLTLDSVRREFYKVLDAAGIRRLRPYDLRHTMASLVLNETKDVKLVATRLGHANEYLVLRTYGHLMPGVDRAATDLLSERLRRVRAEADGTRMADEDDKP